MFAGDNGGFAEYLENAKGDTVKVRAGDGVHFDTAGGDLIAREVLKQLNELFDLTSWRKQKAADGLRGAAARRQRRWEEPAADGGAAGRAECARPRGRVDHPAERQRPSRLRRARDGGRGERSARRSRRRSGCASASSSAPPTELAAVAAATRSSPRGSERDPATLHVAFLSEQPARRRGRDARPRPLAARRVRRRRPRGVPQLPERIRPLAPHARLPRARLGVQGTARNWRTVQRLAALPTVDG